MDEEKMRDDGPHCKEHDVAWCPRCALAVWRSVFAEPPEVLALRARVAELEALAEAAQAYAAAWEAREAAATAEDRGADPRSGTPRAPADVEALNAATLRRRAAHDALLAAIRARGGR